MIELSFHVGDATVSIVGHVVGQRSMPFTIRWKSCQLRHVQIGEISAHNTREQTFFFLATLVRGMLYVLTVFVLPTCCVSTESKTESRPSYGKTSSRTDISHERH